VPSDRAWRAGGLLPDPAPSLSDTRRTAVSSLRGPDAGSD